MIDVRTYPAIYPPKARYSWDGDVDVDVDVFREAIHPSRNF